MDAQPAAAAPATEEASREYLGQWHRLVSTTNWEKGRIILGWRQALIASGAPSSEYSDDAWSQRVGNVTPQHVGRLRRVAERFGDAADDYDGLFWSHFQACLDWDDAEMWLEGAVQSDWSVAQLRKTRWEAMGAPAEQKPRESDIFAAEIDEDAGPMADLHREKTLEASLGVVRGPNDESDADEPRDIADDDEIERKPVVEPKRPFAELPSLPADVTDAFEAFKLCILRHRLAGWQEISLDDALATLDALKELASAPSE